MADYIKRQAALDALGVTKNATKYGGDHSGYDTMMLYEIHDVLTGLPSADVAPVVHSRWKCKCGEIQCLECGNRIHRIDLSGCLNFCPHCGAKMDA